MEPDMTTPAPGTTPAPAAGPPADPGQPPANGPTGTPAPTGSTPPAGAPATEPTPKPEGGPPADPPGKTYTEDYVKQLRAEAAGHRTGKTAAEQKAADLEATVAAFRKVLDPNAAPEDDPKKVAEKAIAERDAQAAELKAMKTERLAEKAARKAGADVDALLDSRGFTAALSKLDAASATFEADIAELVETSVKANPRLKTTAPRSVADSNGGTTQPGQLTREHLKSMTPEEIVKAQDDGRLRALLGN